MNEAETRAEHIDPALKAAGWGGVEGSRIRREFYFTPGRIEGHGRRGKPLKADYILEYRNHKLAVRFAYSSNGRGIYGIDMLAGKEGSVATFPSPEELWNRTFAEENLWRDRFAGIPYPDKTG